MSENPVCLHSTKKTANSIEKNRKNERNNVNDEAIAKSVIVEKEEVAAVQTNEKNDYDDNFMIFYFHRDNVHTGKNLHYIRIVAKFCYNALGMNYRNIKEYRFATLQDETKKLIDGVIKEEVACLSVNGGPLDLVYSIYDGKAHLIAKNECRVCTCSTCTN